MLLGGEGAWGSQHLWPAVREVLVADTQSAEDARQQSCRRWLDRRLAVPLVLVVLVWARQELQQAQEQEQEQEQEPRQ